MELFDADVSLLFLEIGFMRLVFLTIREFTEKPKKYILKERTEKLTSPNLIF